MRQLTHFAILSLAILLACSTCVVAASCCSGSSACVSVASEPDNTLTAQEKADGWRLLFDGKSLNGWGNTANTFKGWVVDNSAIQYNRQGEGYVYTKDRFGDFELKIDLMVDNGTNSGIFFRWDKLDDPVQTGIEMQVFDSASWKKPDKHECGAIYDILAPSQNAMKPALQWNTVLLKCRGQFITITMNGKRIIQMDLNKYTEPHKNLDGSENKFDTAFRDMPRVGHIGLQAHGGKVWYKNIKILGPVFMTNIDTSPGKVY